MKWIRFTGAVVATLGLTTAAQAGFLDLLDHHGSGKSCGCAPSYQPRCCQPTITKPCCPTVHTYQRKISDKKPPCCDVGCAPQACCPKNGWGPKGCAAPAPDCAAPAPDCAAPPKEDVAPEAPPKDECAAPAPGPKCAAPAPGPKCAAPAPANGCCPQAKGCCPHQGCYDCEYADPCEIAKLIYQSQTACYAKDRRDAIHTLGDDFSCVCNPEIMVAFIYALNDADERVREKAADEIGDQLREYPCCCSKEVVAALTAALGDCDKGVRKQAEEALEECGYEVIDGCCDGVCCDPCQKPCGGCVPGGECAAPNGCVAPNGCAPAAPNGNGGEKSGTGAPPLPGTEKVFFPSRLRRKKAPKRSRLANLFGLLD